MGWSKGAAFSFAHRTKLYKSGRFIQWPKRNTSNATLRLFNVYMNDWLQKVSLINLSFSMTMVRPLVGHLNNMASFGGTAGTVVEPKTMLSWALFFVYKVSLLLGAHERDTRRTSHGISSDDISLIEPLFERLDRCTNQSWVSMWAIRWLLADLRFEWCIRAIWRLNFEKPA